MDNYYDVIVIGGGPSGMMAAIAAAERGAKVLLAEKMGTVGMKLALTGGGRCNLTNSVPVSALIENLPGGGKFLYSALNQWNNADIMNFFEGLGIRLCEEADGRIFPLSGDAKTLISALQRKMASLDITVRYNAAVSEIFTAFGETSGIRLSNCESVTKTSNVIVATGGSSFPQTGSSGDGLELARSLGHSISPLSPGEVPLTSNDSFTGRDVLQGLSLQDISVTLINNAGKKTTTQRGDMLFTHFGLSGPVILRLSTFVLKELSNQNDERISGHTSIQALDQLSKTHSAEGEVKLSIDIFPDKPEAKIANDIGERMKSGCDKSIKNGLRALLPERLLQYFLKLNAISPNRRLKTLTSAEVRSLSALCKNFVVHINGSLPLEHAFVTCGGVVLNEVDPKTMQSKLIRNLYFCGEVLDINGHTGGFNLTAAFTTGHLAGLSAGGLK